MNQRVLWSRTHPLFRQIEGSCSRGRLNVSFDLYHDTRSS